MISCSDFWFAKDMSLNDENTRVLLHDGENLTSGFNNFGKKWISYIGQCSFVSLRVKDLNDVDEMGNRIDDNCDELDG